jgi:hypothetical protein
MNGPLVGFQGGNPRVSTAQDGDGSWVHRSADESQGRVQFVQGRTGVIRRRSPTVKIPDLRQQFTLRNVRSSISEKLPRTCSLARKSPFLVNDIRIVPFGKIGEAASRTDNTRVFVSH